MSSVIVRKANRLSSEKSPYLLQHQYNPVDWYPWGIEAFNRARELDRPIFLSVGYSTCHWCHVMEHESFESPIIAKLLNENFVSVKVDREERPDIDRQYMFFVQATTGSGGWPMSVFLEPSRLYPFFGGTYFPPSDRYGQPGFASLLTLISGQWKNNRTAVLKDSESIMKELVKMSGPKKAKNDEKVLKTWDILDAIFVHFEKSFDSKYGGFGRAPKFPTPSILNFLMSYGYFQRWIVWKGKGEIGKVAEEQIRKGQKAQYMAEFTLKAMASGGIYDHVGKGFHRYSTDKEYHVPHFEKMLYDQAQLLKTYSDAYSITLNPSYLKISDEIVCYCMENLFDEKICAFWSAQDADSLPEPESHERKEGAFAVWTHEELSSLLKDSAEIFMFIYGCKKDGNVDPSGDPHGELKGKNVLIQRYSFEEAAKKFSISSESKVTEIIEKCKQILGSKRKTRPLPHLDDKVITSWNALMLTGLIRYAQVFQEKKADIISICKRVIDFFMAEMMIEKDGKKRLLRTFRKGPSGIEAFAEDYAFLCQAMISMYETTLESRYLECAIDLQNLLDQEFWDNKDFGYFSASGKDPTVILRLKEEHDGAEPSYNSVACSNLIKLYGITGKMEYGKRAMHLLSYFRSLLKAYPYSMPSLAESLMAVSVGGSEIDFEDVNSSLHPPSQIVLRKGGDFVEGGLVLSCLERSISAFHPLHVVRVETPPSTMGLGTETTLHLCESQTCGLALSPDQSIPITPPLPHQQPLQLDD